VKVVPNYNEKRRERALWNFGNLSQR